MAIGYYVRTNIDMITLIWVFYGCVAFPLILLKTDFFIVKIWEGDYEHSSHIPYNTLLKVSYACSPVSLIFHMTGFSSESFMSEVD